MLVNYHLAGRTVAELGLGDMLAFDAAIPS